METKVIIVTGASSGIGESTAKELSKKHKVVLASRNEEKLKFLTEKILSEGGEAIYKKTDVSSLLEVQELVSFVLNRYKKIDVLINNAGIMPLSSIFEQKIDEWDKMIDINIKGVLYGISAVLPVMRSQGFGHIISLSSIAGHLIMPTMAIYSATKYAVRVLMEGLRKEEAIAKSHIRLTTISPGAVDTQLLNTITSSALKESLREFYKGSISSENIAKIIAFAIEQPSDVSLNEIIIRPTSQEP